MLEEKDEEDEDKQKLSKRKQKILSRLSVAELKQLVIRPDVVEMHDVTAKDPGNICLHFSFLQFHSEPENLKKSRQKNSSNHFLQS